MLPVAPDEVIPTVEPMPSVPPEARAKVPAPETTLVPVFSVPPLLTVIVLPDAMLRPLFKVRDAPLSTVMLICVVSNVPPDSVKVLPAPVKCKVAGVVVLSDLTVPPVWL